MRWPLQPLQPFQQTQLQPPFGQSVASLCHPWFTTTNFSYRFPIFETSATALCGTTGTTLITPPQRQLQLHYTNYTTLQLQLQLHYTTLYIQKLWVRWPTRWPLQPLHPLQKTQLQPPFGPSVDTPCHPWFTTTNLSYRFPIFETSATALCGTTGTTLITPPQMQLQLHYTNYTTLQLQLQLHYTTLYIQKLWVRWPTRWPLQPLHPLQKTQLQPPFGPSVDSPCHPWFTTTNLSYRFPICETSATALCGTTGKTISHVKSLCAGSITCSPVVDPTS